MSADPLLRQLRDELSQPISSNHRLLSLLAQPLDLLGLLPLNQQHPHLDLTWPSPKSSLAQQTLLSRLPGIQHALFTHVLPVWWDVLVEGEHEEDRLGKELITCWFCPSTDGDGHQEFKARIALGGFQVLGANLTPSLRSPSILKFSLNLLQTFPTDYPFALIFSILFPDLSNASDEASGSGAKRVVQWESYVKALATTPAKVMNLTEGGRTVPVPKPLETPAWNKRIVLGMDQVVWEASLTNGFHGKFFSQLSPPPFFPLQEFDPPSLSFNKKSSKFGRSILYSLQRFSPSRLPPTIYLPFPSSPRNLLFRPPSFPPSTPLHPLIHFIHLRQHIPETPTYSVVL